MEYNIDHMLMPEANEGVPILGLPQLNLLLVTLGLILGSMSCWLNIGCFDSNQTYKCKELANEWEI